MNVRTVKPRARLSDGKSEGKKASEVICRLNYNVTGARDINAKHVDSLFLTWTIFRQEWTLWLKSSTWRDVGGNGLDVLHSSCRDHNRRTEANWSWHCGAGNTTQCHIFALIESIQFCVVWSEDYCLQYFQPLQHVFRIVSTKQYLSESLILISDKLRFIYFIRDTTERYLHHLLEKLFHRVQFVFDQWYYKLLSYL